MKNLKKLLLATVALLASGFGASAATQLTLTLSDGSTPAFLLADKPTLTIEGSYLVISTADATASYQRSSIVKMEFANVDAAVETIETGGTQLIAYINGTITADGQINIYDLSGRNVLSGIDALPTDTLLPGTYVVKTACHTIKIAVK